MTSKPKPVPSHPKPIPHDLQGGGRVPKPPPHGQWHGGPVTAPKPPPHPAPKPKPPVLTSTQQNVYDLMTSLLKSWGLSTLAGDLKKLVVNGDTSPDTLSLALSQTQAYKTRFSANAVRVKNGLSELSPAQYLAMEEGYQNVLNAYGFPKGFYDSKSDFTDLIGKDISADELKARAQVAHDQYMSAPNSVRNLWEQYYGTKGDALAAILDPNVATQLILDRGQQVAIGGSAAQFGLGVNQQRAQQFQEAGVSLEGARKAYQQIASTIGTDQSIAQRFGTTFDQSQEENDLLLGDAGAGIKRQSLYNQEEALFHGNAGFDGNALGVAQTY